MDVFTGAIGDVGSILLVIAGGIAAGHNVMMRPYGEFVGGAKSAAALAQTPLVSVWRRLHSSGCDGESGRAPARSRTVVRVAGEVDH